MTRGSRISLFLMAAGLIVMAARRRTRLSVQLWSGPLLFALLGLTGYLLQDAQCVVLEIVEDVTPDVPNRVDRIRQRIQTALRQYFFYTIGRRPVIMPFLVEV